MKKYRSLAVVIAFAGILTTGCFGDIVFIEGSGEIVTETLELDEFTSINMMGIEDLVISYGETQEVSVVGDDNIIGKIKREISNGTWNICLERGSYRSYELKYYITLPRINEITNEGVSDVTINDFQNEGDLYIGIDGAGRIELNRMENTENLTIDINGVGQVIANDEFPNLQELNINIDGAGKYFGFPINTKNCTIDINGTGKVEVSVIENLNIIIDGAGSVFYKGSPTINKDISGVATIKNVND